jgi:hypothetical protein
MRFAEEANYFSTTVHPAASMGEIQAMLDDFGADTIQTMTGFNNGKSYWMIRFKWLDKFYRFTFQPLTCQNPDKLFTIGGKKRTVSEQAKYQMGRIAVNAVKAVLTAAEAMPGTLYGFTELPVMNEDGIPAIVSEIDISKFKNALPAPTSKNGK